MLDLNPDLASDMAPCGANFAFASFFVERGMGSGKVYQPPVNHRSMNLNVVTKTHGEGNLTRSLLDSHANPRADERFHRNEKVTLYPYAIRDKVVGKGDVPVKGLHDVKLNKGDCPDANLVKDLFCIPSALDRVAGDLTKRDLKRVMDVLNVTFDGSDYESREQLDTVAPMKDVVHFLQHFASIKLRTKEDIRSFMNDYSLTDIIYDELDHSKSIWLGVFWM